MNIELISEEFRLQQANRYSLWLHLSDDYCSFVILDDALKSFVGMKRVDHLSLTKTIELLDELSAISFNRVFIALNAQPSVLVPRVLFRQENKRDLLGFTADFNEEYDVVEHYLPSLSAVNIFALAPSFKTFVTPYFPQACLIHISSALLLAVFNLSRMESQQTIGVRVMENQLSVCLFDGGKLLLCNHFSVKANEDVIYWILRVCDQFNIHTSATNLYILGVKSVMDESIAFLKPYFQKLSLMPFPDEMQLSPELKTESIELFMDMFYLPLCEL